MIKANELRIGNWFIGYDNKQFQFDYTDFMIIGTPAQWEQKPFEPDELIKSPIKLTEEILLNCGFEQRSKTEDGVIYGLGNITLIYCHTTDNDFGFFLNGYHNDVHIRELHQLQNLYFELTGQELEVKL